MASLDEDELPPPPKEPSTVARSMMSQMMSVPEVAEAWKEVMRAYETAGAGIDTAESERLVAHLGLDQCEKKAEEAARLSERNSSGCGARSEPVTLAELVTVFRENGVTLDIQEDVCGKPEEKQVAGFDSYADRRGFGRLRRLEQARRGPHHVRRRRRKLRAARFRRQVPHRHRDQHVGAERQLHDLSRLHRSRTGAR